MVEMMLAVVMTALVIGGVTGVYAYTMERMSYGVADARTQGEAEYGIDVIDSTISMAQSCTLVSIGGIPCLKCVMPAVCTDNNGDGILDHCTPDAINRRSLERWGTGYRVWFYLSDLTGTAGNQGSSLWMAKRSDDLNPTPSDDVKAFTYFPGNSKLRLTLLQALTASTSTMSNACSAQLSFGAYAGQGNGAAPSSASPATSYQFSLARTTYMHGWRY